MWDESDSDIKAEFNQLEENKTSLTLQIREINDYQTCIRNLKMNTELEKSEGKDDKTIFVQPTDNEGNKMDQEYRVSQKAELIKNITKFKKTLL